MGGKCPGSAAPLPQTNAQNFRGVKVIGYAYKGQSEGVKTFFSALHLTLGGKRGRDDL